MPKGKHQCLVFSLAMLLDEDVDVLIQELGHDGMQKVFKGPVPHCYNGHHMQEIIDVCIGRGHSLTPVEYFSRFASAIDPEDWRALYPSEDAALRFSRLIANRRGILIGCYRGHGHAVAWDGDIIWDPNGIQYPLSDFKPLECWLLDITSEKQHLK
jgi:hypothetical protein